MPEWLAVWKRTLEKGKAGLSACGIRKTACGFAYLFHAGFQRIGDLRQRPPHGVIRNSRADFVGIMEQPPPSG